MDGLPGLGACGPVARRGGYQRAARPGTETRRAEPPRGVAPAGRRSGAAAALVDVPVGDRDVEVLVAAVARGEVLGDRDRAVAPAGAADRDHQVRLALGDVLRQQEVEQRDQPLVELLQAPVAGDVLDDALRRGRSASRSSGS